MDSYEREMRSHTFIGEIGTHTITGIHLEGRDHTPPGKPSWHPAGHQPLGGYEHSDCGLSHVDLHPSGAVMSRVSRTLSSIARVPDSPPTRGRGSVRASYTSGRNNSCAGDLSAATQRPRSAAARRTTGSGGGGEGGGGGKATPPPFKARLSSSASAASRDGGGNVRGRGSKTTRRTPRRSASSTGATSGVMTIPMLLDNEVRDAMRSTRDAMHVVQKVVAAWEGKERGGGEEEELQAMTLDLRELLDAVARVEGVLGSLWEGRDEAAMRLAAVQGVEEKLAQSKSRMSDLTEEMRSMRQKKDATIADLRGEKDALSRDRDALSRERDAALSEAGSLRAERDAMCRERDGALSEAGLLRGEREALSRALLEIRSGRGERDANSSNVNAVSGGEQAVSGVNELDAVPKPAVGDGGRGGGMGKGQMLTVLGVDHANEGGGGKAAAPKLESFSEALEEELSLAIKEKERLELAARTAKEAMHELSYENDELRGQVEELGDGMSCFETARLRTMGSTAEFELRGLHVEGDALLERVARLGRQLHAAKLNSSNSSRGTRHKVGGNDEEKWCRVLSDASAVCKETVVNDSNQSSSSISSRMPFTKSWISGEEITLEGVMRDQAMSVMHQVVSPIKRGEGGGNISIISSNSDVNSASFQSFRAAGV